ncbi:MAG TPA: hypothetical protein VIU93_10215 [Gallionellaceae bacterium]
MSTQFRIHFWLRSFFPPDGRALIVHDYEAWARTLLAEREQAGFPPFVLQALLRAEVKNEGEVYAFTQQAHAAATAVQGEVEVYGVVPAATRKSLQQFLRAWKLRWSLDVDPLDF